MSCSSSTPLSPRVLAPRHALRAWGLATLLAASACVDDPTAIRSGSVGPMLNVAGATEADMGLLGLTPVWVKGLSDAGQVAGHSYHNNPHRHARGFLWGLGSGMQDVPGTPYCGTEFNCIYSYVTAINRNGMITGWLQRESSAVPFRWSKQSGIETINRPLELNDINDAGDVVGRETQGGSYVVVWKGTGGVIRFIFPHINLKINNQGEILGGNGSRSFLWQSGSVLDLGTLGGSTVVHTDLNDDGYVVGQSDVAGNGAYHAFRWTPAGGMQDLGTLGGANSRATAVNASGHVVGWSETTGRQRHAFLWTPAFGMQDLGTLPAVALPGLGPPGAPNSEANDINDVGEITGYSTTGYTSPFAVVWTGGGGIQALGNGVGQHINNHRQVAGISTYPPENFVSTANVRGRFWYNIVMRSGPIPEAGGPYEGVEGQAIEFDASGTTHPGGDSLRFAWDFNGDGALDATGVQVHHAFAVPGTYTVRLFATDASSITRMDDATVTVEPAHWPSAIIVPLNRPYAGAEGARILLSSAGSASEDGGPLFYRWELGDGTYAQSRFQTTPFNWSKIYADNGTYMARLIVSDTSRRSDTASVQVVVRNAAPTGSFVILSVVYENTDFPMTVQNATDSAVADRRAGLTYAFDCGTGGGYGAFSATVTQSCRAPVDDTQFTAGARIRDKDGGVREHRYTLFPRNVRPYVTGATWANGVLTIGFSDVGSNDGPWQWTVVWGDGTRSTGLVDQQGPAAVQAPHTYAGPGPFNAQVYVYDKDWAPASPVYPVTITP